MLEFFRRVDDLRRRSYVFFNRGSYGMQKAAYAAHMLINRADAIVRGGDTTRDNWGFRQHNFTSPEGMLDQAESYLVALERGKNPLNGLFGELGACTVDHCFFEADGIMHVFYCRGTIGYSWPERSTSVIGHAVTRDLKHYEILPPALSIRKESRFSAGAWSPSVIRAGDRYVMYYTAINEALCEATLCAFSKDLLEWEPCEREPVFVPGPWSEWSEEKWSDNRDIMLFRDDDGLFYQYYATVRRSDEGLKPACGVARSKNLLDWEDLGAFYLPSCRLVCESPFLVKRDGRYYLFYSNIGVGTCYVVSDDPVSGWETPETDVVLPDGVTCSEIFPYRGNWYISFVTQYPNIVNLMGVREMEWRADGTPRAGRLLTED